MIAHLDPVATFLGWCVIVAVATLGLAAVVNEGRLRIRAAVRRRRLAHTTVVRLDQWAGRRAS